MGEIDVRPRSLSDHLLVLLKWRRVVVLNVIAVAGLTAIVSLVVPKWYTSTGTILPSESTTTDVGFLSFIETTLPGLRLPGVSTPSEVTVGILESRRVAEEVIGSNGLAGVYRAKTMDEAVRALEKRTSIVVDDNGVVRVEAEARDPKLAASMVQSYLDALERYNREARSTTGRKTREFVQSRLDETVAELAEAEERLTAFQRENTSIEITEQARALITALSDIGTRAATAEIELGILKSYASPDHPEVRRLETEIAQYKRALDAIRSGSPSGDAGGILSDVPWGSLKSIPEIALQFVRLSRDVEVLNKIYLFLVQEVEAAKIQEAKDTPTIQILDNPIPAELRTRPRRTTMVVIGGLIGIVVGCLAAFILEFLSTTDSTHPTRRTLDAAVAMLKSDLRRVRGR